MANYQLSKTGQEIDDILDKALTKPSVAPATQKVVTIETDGSQGLEDMPTGTNVVANPTLAGTESDLTGLQVGDTKYKVPSGGGGGGTQLYKHTIRIQHSPLDQPMNYVFYAYSIYSTPITDFNAFRTTNFITENKCSSSPVPLATELYVIFIKGNTIYHYNPSTSSIETIILSASDIFTDTVETL